jgi:hypothetical protein
VDAAVNQCETSDYIDEKITVRNVMASRTAARQATIPKMLRKSLHSRTPVWLMDYRPF